MQPQSRRSESTNTSGYDFRKGQEIAGLEWLCSTRTKMEHAVKKVQGFGAIQIARRYQ